MQHKYSNGVSLIEMMVAVAISVFLGAGVIQIFASNKQTYRIQEAVSVIQENGRFAMNFLTDDIRMAGFLGCSGMTSGIVVTNNIKFNLRNHGSDPGYSAEVDTALDGFVGTDGLHGYSYASGTPATELSGIGLSGGTSEGNLFENTDILVIKRGGSCPGSDVQPAPDSGNEKIADNSVCQIKKNDIVMISNCVTADIFGVSNTVITTPGAEATITHGSNWNDGAQLTPNSYGPGAGMFKLRNNIFFIGVGSSGQPALFKRRLGTLATNNGSFVNDELVEGIEDMTILYGVDLDTPLDGVADSYLNAAAVELLPSKFDQVVSVRISLVARSLEDNITIEANNGDHRLRRTFTATVAIRNRTSG